MTFDLSNLPPLSSLNHESLLRLRDDLRELYHEVESLEPDDEESEEYESWLEDLEEIDDMMDEITERLED